jgi:hypothetical protein
MDESELTADDAADDGEAVREDEPPESIDVQPEDPNHPGTESPEPIS